MTAEIARYPADQADESPTIQLPVVPADADAGDILPGDILPGDILPVDSEAPPIGPVFTLDDRPQGRGPGPVF